MWPNKPIKFVTLKKDLKEYHFGGFRNENLVRFVSLFINNNMCQFRKLPTLENYQGKGFTTKLLNHIISFSKTKNVTKIWYNARENKTHFHQNFN